MAKRPARVPDPRLPLRHVRILQQACIEALEARTLLNDALQVDATQVLNSITHPFLGVNYVAYWDPLQGSDNTLRALKNAGIQMIRFPGGVVGDWYNWDNPASWDVYNGGNVTSPLRMRDIAQFVGAQMMFQTNPTTNAMGGIPNDPSGAHAADWVQYMNDNNGYVPYWEIGNEEDMGSLTPPSGQPWVDYNWAAYQW